MESDNVLRLLDANLNRCREGLRVLEDTARFLWKDEEWFKKFRTERHRLEKMTRPFYSNFLEARDTVRDEGRKIKESGRADLKSVVAANFRRCEESLRVVEEYGKLLSKNSASDFKRMRFKIYNFEKKVLEKYF